MNRINNDKLRKINGGAGVSSAVLNALMRTISVMFSLGQAVGSAVRRTSQKNYC